MAPASTIVGSGRAGGRPWRGRRGAVTVPLVVAVGLASVSTATAQTDPTHRADPSGCTRRDNAYGGVDITCPQGIPKGATLQGTDGEDHIKVSTSTSGGTANAGTINGGGGFDHIVITGQGAFAEPVNSLNRGVINGGDGPDNIELSGQARNLVGGEINGDAGNDRISVGSSVGLVEERINGGTGNDVIIYENPHTGTIHGDEGKDTISTRDNRSGQIYGDSGDDHITVTGSRFGNHENSLVDGGTGSDTVTVTATDSYSVANRGTIRGDAGNDTITARSNGEVGWGNAEKRGIITGGAGNDTITTQGGTGANAARATVDAGPGTDTCEFVGRKSGKVRNCEKIVKKPRP